MDKRRFVGTSLDNALGNLNEWLSEGNSLRSISVDVDDSLYESHTVWVTGEGAGNYVEVRDDRFDNIRSISELRKYLYVTMEEFAMGMGISSASLYNSWQRSESTQRYYANLMAENYDVPFDIALDLVKKRTDGSTVDYGKVPSMEDYPYMEVHNLNQLKEALQLSVEDMALFLDYTVTSNMVYLPERGYRTRLIKANVLRDKLNIPLHHGMKIVSTPWDEEIWRKNG